jgi:hypothetical protein
MTKLLHISGDSITKTCPRCKQEKLIVAFNRHARRADGCSVYCRDCKKELSDDYYKRVEQLHVSEKECTICHVVKPVSAFLKSRYRKYGIHSGCYECEIAARKKNGCRKTVTEKKCSKCGELKQSSQFTTNKSRPDGLSCWCKACARVAALKETYGITVQEYERMFMAQGGLCAICGKPSLRKLHVDHCHSKGTIRGLLCRKCNKGIGFLDDNIQSLKNAVKYLERFK